MIESSANRRLPIFEPTGDASETATFRFILQNVLYLCQVRPRYTEMRQAKCILIIILNLFNYLMPNSEYENRCLNKQATLI